MEELIIKMAACLLGALALGFVLGWLIKRAFAKESYGTQIEGLELDLAKQKEDLLETQKESEHIREQFLSTKNILDEKELKLGVFEKEVVDYQNNIGILKETMQTKEQELTVKLDENRQLNTQFSALKKELDTKGTEVNSHLSELQRVKEHHTILQNEVQLLKKEQESKHKEVTQLSSLVSEYKNKEAQFVNDTKAQGQKVAELESTLNEKNIATLELGNKVKEIDTLNVKNRELSQTLEQTQRSLKKAEADSHTYKNALSDFQQKIAQNQTVSEADVSKVTTQNNEGFFDKLEHSIKDGVSDLSTKFNKAGDSGTTDEGFDFMGFAKKTIKKVTETGEDIIAKGDRALKDYKDTK